jgi:protein-S-isoprenylcysteine O-methyltransferase Ste14
MLRSLGVNITDTVETRRDHTLIRHGPYRWIRHPLNSFGALLFTGINLMAASWFILLLSCLWFALIVIRASTEEAKLIEKFGAEYRDYMRRTGRFVPRWIR